LINSLREIALARVTGVSKKWLQDYVNAKYASVERQVKVSAKEKIRLNLECDEHL